MSLFGFVCIIFLLSFQVIGVEPAETSVISGDNPGNALTAWPLHKQFNMLGNKSLLNIFSLSLTYTVGWCQ
jgi:hypothetical protein